MPNDQYRDLDRRIERLESGLNKAVSVERGYSAGTSFPTGISDGFLFYRTDLDWLCVYDGTRWLTTHEYAEPLTMVSGTIIPKTDASYVLNQSLLFNASRSDYGIYATRVQFWTYITTTNNGSNYWVMEVTNTGTVLATFSTVADSANTNLYKSADPATALATGRQYWQLRTSNNVGTPGDISFLACTVSYRLIVT